MRIFMKQFTATFFTILAILYLSDRYTGFEMLPAILIGAAAALIIIIALALAGGMLLKTLYSFTVLILTVIILLTLIGSKAETHCPSLQFCEADFLQYLMA